LRTLGTTPTFVSDGLPVELLVRAGAIGRGVNLMPGVPGVPVMQAQTRGLRLGLTVESIDGWGDWRDQRIDRMHITSAPEGQCSTGFRKDCACECRYGKLEHQ
jgi:hypothetical protein